MWGGLGRKEVLSPWIESLILGYGEQREESHGGQLKARVIEVGDISKSQDVGSEGPAGLLFLSDGLLQIPAILTKSAWEHLQQEEDRECFTSLVNTTVWSALSSPQPSTSTSTWDQLATHTDTTWGVDRVKYKGVEGFKVPMKCLLISAENALQNQTPLNVRGGTAGELFAPREDREGSVPPPSESTSPSIDDAEWRVANGEEENAMADVKDLSNPWDAFPPPWETSSSSDASPRRLVDPAAAAAAAPGFRSDHPVIPAFSPKESQQASEPSNLPPYQKLQQSSASPCASPPEYLTGLSEAAPAADQGRTDSPPPPPPPASDQVEETVEREYGKAKRKRSEPTTWVEEGEAQVSGSSPSWLFDTQAGCRAHEGSSPWKPPRTPARTVPRSTATARRFSYSYLPSGQNLHDFSRFKVAESFLRWAVRYLVVPKQTGDPAAADQALSDEPAVTSL
uniref:Shelterin complex subunit TPP1/Est3 domain-containing protein n=1 Tax=Gasterosteus aculeatus aculeatus TaxID=481459 RepID=A0AAQ4P7M7_GASAC